ncbi:MAG: hypothetical protein NC117_04665 [Pseudoflavonifractor sp.]|nr:hypothetical protein [Pseudoflavonifractor sp.]
MKKLVLLLLVLPFILTACDDDDKIPDVNFDVTMSGGVSIDGTVYVVQGDILSVDGITVIAGDNVTKGVSLGGATYYWDYEFAGATVQAPFGCSFDTESARIGNHLLQIECPVLAVGFAPATALVSYFVTVVESEDDIPAGAEDAHGVVKPEMKAGK